MLGRPSVGVGVGAATYTAAVVTGAKGGAASEAG